MGILETFLSEGYRIEKAKSAISDHGSNMEFRGNVELRGLQEALAKKKTHLQREREAGNASGYKRIYAEVKILEARIVAKKAKISRGSLYKQATVNKEHEKQDKIAKHDSNSDD